MSDVKGLLADPDAWAKAFSQRLSDYEKLIDGHSVKRREFEVQRQSALEELERAWAAELETSNDALAEVAPISAQDVDAIPTRRAAYSDRTAALLAKVAMLAYIGFEDSAKRSVLEGTLTHGRVKLLETLAAGDTEALVAETDKFVVVAFRGTHGRRDVRTDLNLFTRKVKVENREVEVHAGFYRAFRHIEGQLRDCLAAQRPELPIYLTGHSLGGALALVAAAAFGGSDQLGDRIAAIYTFGAPRVGGASFPVVVKAPHYRVINKGDAVPLVPPNWISGYRHTGAPILLKRNSTRPIRRRQRTAALFLALRSVLLWPFTRRLLIRSAHAMETYVARLERIARFRGRWT